MKARFQDGPHDLKRSRPIGPEFTLSRGLVEKHFQPRDDHAPRLLGLAQQPRFPGIVNDVHHSESAVEHGSRHTGRVDFRMHAEGRAVNQHLGLRKNRPKRLVIQMAIIYRHEYPDGRMDRAALLASAGIFASPESEL